MLTRRRAPAYRRTFRSFSNGMKSSMLRRMEQWDVIVVGAGAAGLVATGAAARGGARVLALEKMGRPARKVGISGKGRCNLTTNLPIDVALESYPRGSGFLRNAFSRFFADDIIELLTRRDVPCVTERGGRVFPKSGKAGDVVNALYRYARGDGGAVRPDTTVTGITLHPAGFLVQTGAGDLLAHNVILTTGGKSYPRTGSTGDGYRLAQRLGHTLVAPRPTLVPLTIQPLTQPVDILLHNVGIALLDGDKPVASGFGEAQLRQQWLGGAVPIDLSRDIMDLANPVIAIDFKPALDDAKLAARLRRDLDADGKRPLQHVLDGLLPQALIPLFIDRLGLNPGKRCAEVDKKTRRELAVLLKDFRLTVTGTRGYDEALATAGGVALRDIDPRTMESKLVPGLFLAGELLDIDGKTGGFNLQAAFSTGFVAGEAAARRRP